MTLLVLALTDRAVLPLLLSRGADREAVDQRGRMAMEMARANGDEDAVRLLTSP
ncbi:MAG: hypothetical protein U0R19_33460 [Bryobacteraceae bacterium]